MEGALDCGSTDEILRPMFTCRPRPTPTAYCGVNSKINTESELEGTCRSSFCTRNLSRDDEFDSGNLKQLSSNASISKGSYNCSTTNSSDFDVSLTVSVENPHSECASCKPRTSSNSFADNSYVSQINGTLSTMAPIPNSCGDESECHRPNCEDCHFNIDYEGVGLIGQLNDKLRLGQSFDVKSSEQIGLATKAISKLNGCRPKYPSSLGEMPNLCLGKHHHDLETQVSLKETKTSAKCSSDSANSSSKQFSQCKPENWYSDAVMSNGINGFLGLSNVDNNGCYHLNCQSPLCQSRAVKVDNEEFVSHPAQCVLTNMRASFQTQSSLDSVVYVGYESETQMPDIMRLIQKDLSEPYSVYTYRYFIHNWPHLCYLALYEDVCVGAIVCKLDMHKKNIRRGYIAMLAVDENYRKKRIGSNLVLKAIQAMIADDADEVVLETEITNKPALQLYENLGFVRDKRLFRYYLNGVDALRLKLWLR